MRGFRRTAVEAFRLRINARFSAVVVAIVVSLVATWWIAVASVSSAQTTGEGPDAYVAVEPLLRSMQLAYTIEGTHLDVQGRAFPDQLVYRGDTALADARALARFLHVQLGQQHGVLVFSPPDGPAPDAAPTAPPAEQLATLRSLLTTALNAHRADAGLPALADDGLADRAAQFQAQDMASRGVMEHADGTGRSPMQRYNAFGGTATWYGENVGWYGLDASGATALWSAIGKLDEQMMAERPPDDGHRANILDSHYDFVGIGVSVGPGGVYLAEDFVGR